MAKRQPVTIDNKTAAAEILATGGSASEAASAAKVTRQSVWRWANHDPEFRAILTEIRAGIEAEVMHRITGHSAAAVETLAAICKNKEAADRDRINAANSILNRMIPADTPEPEKLTARDVLGDDYDKVRKAVSKVIDVD